MLKFESKLMFWELGIFHLSKAFFWHYDGFLIRHQNDTKYYLSSKN